MNASDASGGDDHSTRSGADDDAPPTDFEPTQTDSLEPGSPDWWPESADGQCSQSAALFAASQPAPLNVV